jgi:hypothetical protein
MKQMGIKGYHAYLSDDLYQDQVFVNIVLRKMLAETEGNIADTIVIESDNCTSQYKLAEHFNGLMEIATEYGVTIIRIYGVAGHGKSEVDHVGGLAKVEIRRLIAAGSVLTNAHEMTDCLNDKFGTSNHPLYYFKEIAVQELVDGHASS